MNEENYKDKIITLEDEITLLKKELEDTKERLKKYSNPERHKKYQEKNKEKLLEYAKEYSKKYYAKKKLVQKNEN